MQAGKEINKNLWSFQVSLLRMGMTLARILSFKQGQRHNILRKISGKKVKLWTK